MREMELHERAAGDPRAPMAAAPIRYLDDGTIDWGNMWDSFCVLARDGGPPHRGEMLEPQPDADVAGEAYRRAAAEIGRGIGLVSGLEAALDAPGWVVVTCSSPGMARWLAEAIVEENVRARYEEERLYLPVGDYFTFKGEVKNVITAVAKTTHYWRQHLPAEVKQALALQAGLARIGRWLGGLVGTAVQPDAG